jgi:hypothetical protein
MSHHRDGLYAGNDVLVYSERLKSSKGDHLLPLTDTQIKLVKSTNDSGSKIKVIDNFETKFEQNNQAGESLVKSAFLPQQSDLARSLCSSSPSSH